MKNLIIAANWKMNKSLNDVLKFTNEIKSLTSICNKNIKIILCPPFLYINKLHELINNSNIFLGAQNVNQHNYGAFTGEISAKMLKSVGCDYAIIGHSERRMHFNENSTIISQKVLSAINNEIIPIFCCGESIESRKNGEHNNYVKNQIEQELFNLLPEQIEKLIIAYEPIWAIGTNIVPTLN